LAGDSTIFLDASSWDLVLDSAGNIAVAAAPYALAQDAASAIQTYAGSASGTTSIGVPYLTQVFGRRRRSPALKALFVDAALTVPGVAAAACFIAVASNRRITGQVQVTARGTGRVAAATFEVINPQGDRLMTDRHQRPHRSSSRRSASSRRPGRRSSPASSSTSTRRSAGR
jgi:hypothetical protein